MKLSLYSKYQNSAGERVRIALALKNIDYEYIAVGSADDVTPQQYAKINPQGLLPALKIDHQVIPQATAILEYLEQVFPQCTLLPTDPILRAQSRGFAQHIVSEMHAIDVVRVRRFLSDKLSVGQAGIEAWQQNWNDLGFAALQTMLAERKTDWAFCFGDNAGWADIHLVPQVRKATSRFGLDLTRYPHIHRIYNQCVKLPAFIAASPMTQTDHPHNKMRKTHD